MGALRRIAIGVMLAGAVGCGDDGGATSIDAGVDGPGPRPTRRVTGHMSEHHVTAPGVDESFPLDLSRATLAAFVPDTLAELPGSGSADGTFLIANVPEGEYYLRFGSRYMARTTDTVDLDTVEFGALDARPATAATKLGFDVTGLAPWQAGDTLELYSPTARLAAYAMEQDADEGAPVAGATSLTGFTYDLTNAASPGLPSLARGDAVVLNHLATRRVGNRTIQAAAGAFTPPPFDVANGDTAKVSGAFGAPPSTPLAITWDRPAFDAELRAHSPGDEADTLSYLVVATLPDARMHGLYASSATLLVFDPGYTTDHAMLTTTGWSYADPYPPAWTRFAFLEYYTYQFIGEVYKLGSITQTVDLATVGSAPIRPAIGLPVDVKVNGRDAFTAQTGVGLTPTISWSAPTFGTADKYLVRVLEVPAADGLISRNLIETTRTSVIIPPGILMAGKRYAFTVMARSATTLDAEATPFRDPSLPNCFARVTTAFVTP